LKVIEVIRKIEAAGWEFKRHAKGSHRVYVHPERTKPIIISGSESKEMPNGLMRQILKDAGVNS
jgi:predicted RNA binding protein YcfA (HicA-like mRNA interferase family)